GAAFGDIRASSPGLPDTSSDKTGWTIGAGLEAALAPNWTAKVEYLYVDLGGFNCGLNCGAGLVTDNVSFPRQSAARRRELQVLSLDCEPTGPRNDEGKFIDALSCSVWSRHKPARARQNRLAKRPAADARPASSGRNESRDNRAHRRARSGR